MQAREVSKKTRKSKRQSAGLLLWRRGADGRPEVFLVHPGGPFWRHRDTGAWSIPKGEIGPGENAEAAALREFREETGQPPPSGVRHPLPSVRLKSGKEVLAWAVQVPLDAGPDPAAVRANTFTLEWPPHSGRLAEFPEIDRAAWVELDEARRKANPAYAPWFDIIETLAEPRKA